MMRSPNSMSVAVRRASGRIIIKEFQWVSLSTKWTFLKKPFFRGMIMLVEAMMNGMSALGFSAEQASLDENADAKKLVGDKPLSQLSKGAIAASMALAFGVGLFMFVVLPHLLTELIGRTFFAGALNVNTFSFHLV